MEPKYSKIFNNTTLNSVQKYCELNKIDNVDSFIYQCFKQGFNIKKYGLLGHEPVNEPVNEDVKTVEIIKEVEKIIEVPVEKIVTKIEYVRDETLEEEMAKKDVELAELRRSLDIILDDSKTKMLQETLQKLRKEISMKNERINELEKINQELQNKTQPLTGSFMRGSNLNDTI